MKEKLTRNISLKILSLLIAVIIWIVIVNVDDPVTSKDFENIPVTTINESAITTINKVFTVVEGDTVTINVKGKRSLVEDLKESDLSAIADLSLLSPVSVADIVPYVSKYQDELVLSLRNTNNKLKVSLEPLETRDYQIYFNEEGEVAPNYYIGQRTARPNMITVSGAESVVSSIDRVVVDVDVSGRMSSFEVTSKPKVYDKNGDLIDPSKLEFTSYNNEVTEVTVSFQLLRTKEVKLNVQLKGEPKSGYELVDFKYEPQTIVIAGEQDVLADISEVVIEIDISDEYENIEKNVEILDYIDTSVLHLVTEEETASISVIIEKLEREVITIGRDQIDVVNLPDNYEIEINTPNINPLVMASSEVLKNLTVGKLKPYIDAAGLDVGTQAVQLKFAELEGIMVLGNPIINVTISELISNQGFSNESGSITP